MFRPTPFHRNFTRNKPSIDLSSLCLSLSLSFPIPFESRSGWDSQSNFARVPPVFEMATNRNRACRESLNAGDARRKRRWLSDDGNNSFGRRESSFGEYSGFGKCSLRLLVSFAFFAISLTSRIKKLALSRKFSPRKSTDAIFLPSSISLVV